MFDTQTRILVVDDMATMRKIVVSSLESLGYSNVIEANDGSSAWTELEGANPPVGLVISDWNMSNISGLSFLKSVRGDPRFANLPFLMLTVEAERQQVIEAINAGVSNYLVKPCTPEQLGAKISAIHKKLSELSG